MFDLFTRIPFLQVWWNAACQHSFFSFYRVFEFALFSVAVMRSRETAELLGAPIISVTAKIMSIHKRFSLSVFSTTAVGLVHRVLLQLLASCSFCRVAWNYFFLVVPQKFVTWIQENWWWFYFHCWIKLFLWLVVGQAQSSAVPTTSNLFFGWSSYRFYVEWRATTLEKELGSEFIFVIFSILFFAMITVFASVCEAQLRYVQYGDFSLRLNSMIPKAWKHCKLIETTVQIDKNAPKFSKLWLVCSFWMRWDWFFTVLVF